MRSLTIEWERLDDRGFESLCCDVLDREGYRNIRWTGGTGDRGRDIQATKYVKMTETDERMFDVIAECKKYLTRPPAISDLETTLEWADVHKPDILIIMVANILTSATRDWLDERTREKPFYVLVFDNKHFELFFDRHPDLYVKHFRGKRMPRERLIRSLLDRKSKTLKDLSGETELPEDPLSALLGKLVGDGLISREETEKKDVCFSLDSSIDTFLKTAELFLNDEERFDFLVSDYSEAMVNTRLADYIASRYHIMMSKTEKQEMIKLLRISPSALHSALFSTTERYDTAHAHAEQMGLRGNGRDKWNKLLVTEFILTLLEKATADLHDPNSKTTLSKNNVEGYDISLKLMMANHRELTLGLGTEATVVLARAAGPVKAGQMVNATDPDMYVWTGDILLHLELFERAITDYDRAISEMKDRDKLAAAWNNKGVCYIALKEWSKAIPCFERALEFNPSMIQARENIKKCRQAREE